MKHLYFLKKPLSIFMIGSAFACTAPLVSLAEPTAMTSENGDTKMVYDDATKGMYENRGYIEAEYTPASPSEVVESSSGDTEASTNIGISADVVRNLESAILYQTQEANAYVYYDKGNMALPQMILQDANKQKMPFTIYVMDPDSTALADAGKTMYSLEFLPGQNNALPDKTLDLGATVTTNENGDISVTFDNSGDNKDVILDHSINLHIPTENGRVYHTTYEGKNVTLLSDYNEIVYNLNDFSDIHLTYDREVDVKKDTALPNYVAVTNDQKSSINEEVLLGIIGIGCVFVALGFFAGRHKH